MTGKWQFEQYRVECNTTNVKLNKNLNYKLALTHSTNSCYSLPLKHESAIADSGVSNKFVTSNASVANPNTDTPVIAVKVTNWQYSYSKGTATLKLKDLPTKTTLAHIISGFPDSLLSIGNLCDTGLHCAFTKISVFAYDLITKKRKITRIERQ